MAPIKVYTDVPLHPEGVTPETAAADIEKQAVLPPTRTTDVSPTDPSTPPPPQPGARPQPGPAPTARLSSGLPPPPQPGARPQPVVTKTHTTTTTGQAPPPTQLSIPPPVANQAPTHSTSTWQPSPFESGTTAASSPLPDGGPQLQRILWEHPSGYQQNPYAADGTPADRARFEQAAREAQEEEGIIGTVMKTLSVAGRRLSQIEDEAWKWAKGRN